MFGIPDNYYQWMEQRQIWQRKIYRTVIGQRASARDAVSSPTHSVATFVLYGALQFTMQYSFVHAAYSDKLPMKIMCKIVEIIHSETTCQPNKCL